MYTSITNRGKSVKDKMIENYYILNQIVQSIDTGILIIFEGRLLHVNNETRRISQRPYRYLEHNLIECVSPDCRFQVKRAYFSVLRGQEDHLDMFVDMVLPSGAPRTVRCRFSRIRIYESDAVFITVHDISDNTLFQKFTTPNGILCRKYMSDNSMAFAKPYDYVVLFDEFFVATAIGHKMEAVTGYKRKDYIGKRFDAFPKLEPFVDMVKILQDCKNSPATRVPRTIKATGLMANGQFANFDFTFLPINFRGVRHRICMICKFLGYLPDMKDNTVVEDLSATKKSDYDFSNKKVIIADDAEINFILLKKIIEKTGVKILHARNGRECVELFRENPDVSLVLMDMQMPIMDGYQASREILAIDSSVPIVAQSAFDMMSERKKILDIGCVDFVSKPIDRNQLLECISKVIR